MGCIKDVKLSFCWPENTDFHVSPSISFSAAGKIFFSSSPSETKSCYCRHLRCLHLFIFLLISVAVYHFISSFSCAVSSALISEKSVLAKLCHWSHAVCDPSFPGPHPACDRRPLGVVTAGSGIMLCICREPRDTVYTITRSQKVNNMFCDTLDVIMWHCQITLSTSFLSSLTAFVSSWHSSWLILNNLGMGLPSEKHLHWICITETV